MSHEHRYRLRLEWTGARGHGTTGYRDYDRDHVIRIDGKPELFGSADPTFRGDPARYNPEELLLAALSACHLMSYLHVCVLNGVVVTAYDDPATGSMVTAPDGSGRFTEVMLNPRVTVANEGMIAKAMELHALANKLCFIANSVNFPVRHSPTCTAQG